MIFHGALLQKAEMVKPNSAPTMPPFDRFHKPELRLPR
jgi:hypothetical protein